MPGVVGFAGQVFDSGAREALERMRALITHRENYQRGALFMDPVVCASASFLSSSEPQADPYFHDDAYIWLHGEIYSLDGEDYGRGPTDWCRREELLASFRRHGDWSFLRNVDGLFSAVVYDQRHQRVHLIADRHGFRHLYWRHAQKRFTWASELKAFLASPGFVPEINLRAVANFFQLGQMLEDRTWFTGVQMMSAATVLTWDARTATVSSFRYWNWDLLTPIKPGVARAASVTGVLFRRAVERRVWPGERVSITLSGGLDSRAILASVPHGSNVTAVTFGDTRSADVRIARLVAAVAGVRHHVVEIRADNWLQPRFRGVWMADGHISVEHLHGIEARDVLCDTGSVNLEGFAGDLVLGGSFMRGPEYCDAPATRRLVAAQLYCSEDAVDVDDAYGRIGKIDAYFLNNRIRRFTYEGVKAQLSVAEQRFPFFDKALFDYVYSLPDSYRYKGSLYHRMLAREFPAYYRRLPWQKTGWPIGTPPVMLEGLDLVRRAYRKARRLTGIPLPPPDPILSGRSFTNYAAWIRQEPGRSVFTKLLCDRNARLRRYIDGDEVQRNLARHLDGEDLSGALGLALTFEIWLRQVLDGELREGPGALIPD